MNFDFERRAVDSSFIQTLWRTQSKGAGSFMSLAVNHWEMVVMRQEGKINLTVRGPETKAIPAYAPAGEAEFFGIQFRLGAFMPHLPPGNLVDGQVNLPEATAKSFWRVYFHAQVDARAR